MKRIVLIAVILTGSLVCKAQYHYHYDPYTYAAAAAWTDEVYRLGNIRFDENAIRQNPEAWAGYQDYVNINTVYEQRRRTYSIVAWSGLGATCASLIPMFIGLDYDYSDSRSDAMIGLSTGLLCAGGIATIVGCVGAFIQIDRIRNNKKEFIYYLKTTNNGVGIVTLF